MEFKSYVYKQRGQWKAETNVRVEGTDQVLKISTYKDAYKRLVTTASVARKEGVFEVFTLYQDFYKTVRATAPKVVNEKRVTEQQQQALDDIDIILAEVKEFYAAKQVAA